jgi:RNA polymerase sigma-70 factor (ECF subfamily)
MTRRVLQLAWGGAIGAMVPAERFGGGQPGRPPEVGRADDAGLIDALRRGDEAAYRALLDRYSATLLRLASIYVSDQAVAADVMQETWIGVLQGIARFEERSSLKTWICRILVNKAKTAAQREGRTLTFSDLGDEDAGPAVDPERFHGHGPNRGRWSIAPQEWDRPEEHLLSKEARAVVERAIAALPTRQRLTITMRDIEDLDSAHTCSALGISEGNQRLLLHRARSKVRAALEAYFSDVTDTP